MIVPSPDAARGCGRDGARRRGASISYLGRATHPNMRREVISFSPAGTAATPAGPVCGGRCVSAGRRTLVNCGLGPLALGGAFARRRGAEFFVAPHDPWQDAAHDDVAKSFGLSAPVIVGGSHAQQHEEVAWKTPGQRTREIFGGVV